MVAGMERRVLAARERREGRAGDAERRRRGPAARRVISARRGSGRDGRRRRGVLRRALEVVRAGGERERRPLGRALRVRDRVHKGALVGEHGHLLELAGVDGRPARRLRAQRVGRDGQRVLGRLLGGDAGPLRAREYATARHGRRRRLQGHGQLLLLLLSVHNVVGVVELVLGVEETGVRRGHVRGPGCGVGHRVGVHERLVLAGGVHG